MHSIMSISKTSLDNLVKLLSSSSEKELSMPMDCEP